MHDSSLIQGRRVSPEDLRQIRSLLTEHTGWLCDKPMSIDWLQVVLRDGYQRQRAAAALELAIRQPGTLLFNVKAPVFRQIQWLSKPGPVIR